MCANSNNSTDFLYHKLARMNLGQYSGQSAQSGLAVTNLIELVAVIPCVAEQKEVASFFSGLDNLIILHQRKSLAV